MRSKQFPRRSELQRLFSTFPGGWPGVGLLLLRIPLGAFAIVDAAVYLKSSSDSTPLLWVIACLAIGSGLFVLLGFLTPVAASFMALCNAILPFLGGLSPGTFESKRDASFAVAAALAIVLTGPGALSLDARLFGRREIVIPPSPRPPVA